MGVTFETKVTDNGHIAAAAAATTIFSS